MPSCRLCQGSLKPKFCLLLLRRHEVQYFVCQACGSLQTEVPHWLDEAYGRNLSGLDTGAAQRNLDNAAATLTLARRIKARNALDFGGGDGLLCRLLRDHGLNAYTQDRYATPIYAQGYGEPDFAVPDLMTAFEVIEHFANPRDELASLFGVGASVVLTSTEIYSGQGEEWWYLVPESGQHVFFYSTRGLAEKAAEHGYDSHFLGRYQLFVRSVAGIRVASGMLRRLYTRRGLKLVRALMQLRATPGAERDFAERQRHVT